MINNLISRKKISVIRKRNKFFCYFNNRIVLIFQILQDRQYAQNHRLSLSFYSYLEFSFLLEKCGLIGTMANKNEFF